MPDPKFDDSKARHPRVDSIKDPYLPDVTHGDHILQWLQEVGPVENGPNGPMALSWKELNAWREATGCAATGEEMLMLRQLSRDYLQQYRAGENPNMPSPVARKGQAKDLSADIRGVLGRHGKKKK